LYEGSTPLETVYFGGGTPSLLPISCVEQILTTLRESFGIIENAEITFEMDPATFGVDKVRDLGRLGVNRISLGVQSFNDSTLRSIGRAHTADDALRAIASVIDGGIENFSIDLIGGLPHMTVESFTETLNTAASCNAKHVSVYDLQVEEKTAFGRWYTPGSFPLPSEDAAAAMYRQAVAVLGSAGFDHYEVSNYAKVVFMYSIAF
jgi:oxygen-independent coproporphyrinogen-3 oxidase